MVVLNSIYIDIQIDCEMKCLFRAPQIAHSIHGSLVAMCRVKFMGESLDDVAGIYPTAEDGRITVAIVHAARIVRDLNFAYLSSGKGAPVTARFGEDGITIIDPTRAYEGPEAVFHKIYGKPL